MICLNLAGDLRYIYRYLPVFNPLRSFLAFFYVILPEPISRTVPVLTGGANNVKLDREKKRKKAKERTREKNRSGARKSDALTLSNDNVAVVITTHRKKARFNSMLRYYQSIAFTTK